MHPDEAMVEFERLLNGVRRERRNVEAARQAKAAAERAESNAKCELARWEHELDKQVSKMSGGPFT